MHKIEQEIIKAANFKPRKKYADRQDYLRSLFLATVNMDDDDFNELSDDAANWINACVTLHNSKSKDDLPDFNEVEPPAEDENDDEPSDDNTEDKADDADPEDDVDEPDGKDEESESEDDEVDEPEEASEDDEPEDESEEVEEPAPKKSKKAARPVKVVNKPFGTGDAELDKWGCIVGSKTSQALAMFEEGASAREVKEAIGGTYYNALAKIVRDGHKMQKDANIIKITHKSDIGKVGVKQPLKRGKK